MNEKMKKKHIYFLIFSVIAIFIVMIISSVFLFLAVDTWFDDGLVHRIDFELYGEDIDPDHDYKFEWNGYFYYVHEWYEYYSFNVDLDQIYTFSILMNNGSNDEHLIFGGELFASKSYGLSIEILMNDFGDYSYRNETISGFTNNVEIGFNELNYDLYLEIHSFDIGT